MGLITAVQVTNFRSLRDVYLEDLTAANAIVGPNNSGKSNLLRALNLFFNDEVEPDTPLDLSEDHYSPWGKRRKEISISVKFDLHRGFTFGKRYRAAEELLGHDPHVKRIWAYDKSGAIVPRFAIYDHDKQDFTLLNEDQVRVVRSFLGLFKFRYIPNHVHPSELINMEQDELQRNFVRRLRSVLSRRRKAGSAGDEVDLTPMEEMFTALSQLAGRAIRPIAQALTEACGEIESFKLDTAQGLDDVALVFGYSMKIRGGDWLSAALQGSGVQAHLAYQMIHFLDTSFGQYFGNRQTVIWGAEEPESFLHTKLEYHLAQFLLEQATTESERFQVFCTTHSDIFTRLATTGVLVQLTDGESKCEIIEPRDLVRKAPVLGISRFVHALLYDRGPLILVEGKTDKTLLEIAYSIARLKPLGMIHCLETLGDTGKAGGKDDLLKYLQQNRAAVNSRPLDAPILVVLDWDVKHRLLEDYKKALAGHPSSQVLRCDVALANPQLGESFKGIERFLSTRVVQHAGQEGWLTLLRPADGRYPLEVSAKSLKDGKSRLVEYMCAEGTEDDFSCLIRLAREIDTAVRAAVGRTA